MPNTKNSFVRFVVIDRCLQNPQGMSTQEIMLAVNEELTKRNEPLVTAKNTVRTDMDFIANNWHVNILEIVAGRRHAYRYENTAFSISKAPLTQMERRQLSQTLLMLGRFSGMPQYEWVEELKAHIGNTMLDDNVKPVVSFESQTGLYGMRCFTQLLDAIMAKQPVCIAYDSFKRDGMLYADVSPYFLKQYNGRWFLFAGSEGFDGIGNYAVDRIMNVTNSLAKYKPTDIDFDDYFRDVVGVTLTDNAERTTVRLWVSQRQYKYIATKPIHPSQQLVTTVPDGAIIELQVIPNFELVQQIFSQGPDMVVLEPPELKASVAQKVHEMNEKYK